MAEKGTFVGEVQRAGRRFWGLPNKVKWPVMIVGAFVLIGLIGSMGGAEEDEPETLASADDAETRETDKSTNTPKPTNTSKPTETPKPPTNTPTPAPPTATPPPPGYTFGSGKKLVGSEVVAGATYRTRSGNGSCYWERLSGLGGTLGEIEANDNTSGPAVVTILESDVAFNSARCGTWTQDLSAITEDPNAPFEGDGTYIVGVDIAAGVWRSDGTGSCYWERQSGFSGGGVDDIIANDNSDGPTIVQISASDKGFKSSRCGTWTKQ